MIVLAMMMGAFVVVQSPSAAADAVTPEWQEGTSMPVSIEQAAVVSNATGTIFVMGGFDETGHAVNSTWSFDPSTGVWSQKADMSVGVRGAAVALGPNGRIVVFGGVNAAENVVATVQYYDPSTDVWAVSANGLFDAVWEAKAAYMPSLDRYYIIGGQLSNGSISNEVQWMPSGMYSVSKYVSGPGLLPYVREAGDLMLSPNGTRLWYFGGVDNTYGAQSTVYEFDPMAPSWTLIDYMPATLACMSVVRAADGLYYVYGGGVTSMNIEPGIEHCYCYNPFLNTPYKWSDGPDMVQATKYFGAVATPDGRIWAIGGGNGTVLNTVQSLQVLTFDVSAPSAANTGEPFLVRLNIAAPFSGGLVSYTGDALIVGGDGTTYGHVAFDSVTSGPTALEMTMPQTAASSAYKIEIINVEVHYSDTDSYRFAAKDLPLTVTAMPTLSDQIDSLEAQVAALQLQLTQTQALLTQAWASGNATAENVTVLQGQLDALESQLADAQASLAQALADIASGNEAASASANETKAQIESLQDQIVLLHDQLNDSQEQLAALQSDNSDLKDTLDSKADGTIAMMTMVFALIAVILMAVILVVLLKKK